MECSKAFVPRHVCCLRKLCQEFVSVLHLSVVLLCTVLLCTVLCTMRAQFTFLLLLLLTKGIARKNRDESHYQRRDKRHEKQSPRCKTQC